MRTRRVSLDIPTLKSWTTLRNPRLSLLNHPSPFQQPEWSLLSRQASAAIPVPLNPLLVVAVDRRHSTRPPLSASPRNENSGTSNSVTLSTSQLGPLWRLL